MNVFFDWDETLAHSYFLCEAYDGTAGIPTGHWAGKQEFYIKKRATADAAISLAQSLFGFNNVYILTLGSEDYLRAAYSALGITVPWENIFFRERWYIKIPLAYNGFYVPQWEHSGSHNLLIDDKPFVGNKEKIDFLQIPKRNYLEVGEYFAVDRPSDKFYTNVSQFLQKHLNGRVIN